MWLLTGRRGDLPPANDIDGEAPKQCSDSHTGTEEYTQVADLVVRDVQLLHMISQGSTLRDARMTRERAGRENPAKRAA